MVTLFILTAQTNTKSSPNEWHCFGTILDCMGWRVTSLFVKRLFSLYKRSGHSNRTSFNGKNRAQTDATGLERFGRHGVESDVTAQNCFCYF